MSSGKIIKRIIEWFSARKKKNGLIFNTLKQVLWLYPQRKLINCAESFRIVRFDRYISGLYNDEFSPWLNDDISF